MTQEESYSELCAKRKVPLDRTTPSFDNLIRKLNDGYEFEGDERTRAKEAVGTRLDFLVSHLNQISRFKYTSKDEASKFLNTSAMIQYHLGNLEDLGFVPNLEALASFREMRFEAEKVASVFYRFDDLSEEGVPDDDVRRRLVVLESVVEEYLQKYRQIDSQPEKLYHKIILEFDPDSLDIDEDKSFQRAETNQWTAVLQELDDAQRHHLLRTTGLYLRYARETGLGLPEIEDSMKEISRLTRLHIENPNHSKTLARIHSDSDDFVAGTAYQQRKRAIIRAIEKAPSKDANQDLNKKDHPEPSLSLLEQLLPNGSDFTERPMMFT